MIRVFESLCIMCSMLIVTLHHGDKWFKEAVGLVKGWLLVHDCINVNIFDLVSKAGRKVEQQHCYRSARSILAHLLVVEWIEKVDRKTPDQSKFTVFVAIKE